jgi:hypothetical protein
MKKTVLGMSVAALLAGAALANAQDATPPSDMQATESSPATTTDNTAANSENTRLAAADLSASKFKKLDENKDGRLSAIEAANDTTIAAGFTKADADKDGYLSKDEFKNLKASDESSSSAPQSSSDSSVPSTTEPSTDPSSTTQPSTATEPSTSPPQS